jgi:hypothetical protein
MTLTPRSSAHRTWCCFARDDKQRAAVVEDAADEFFPLEVGEDRGADVRVHQWRVFSGILPEVDAEPVRRVATVGS